MQKQDKLAQMVSIKLEAKPRYLLELATRIEDCTSTEIVRKALKLYFEQAVSPRSLAEFEEPYDGFSLPSPEMIQGRKAQARRAQLEHSLAKYAELLWEEKPFTRLMKLQTFFPHLLSAFESVMLSYLSQHPLHSADLAQGRALRVNDVSAEDWEQLQADAFAWHQTQGRV